MKARLLLVFVAIVYTGAAQILTLTETQEIEAGKRVAAEVEFEQPLFRDPAVETYLQKIGLRLARESERPGLRFSFRILQSDDINAFALPGGFVYVTRGLLEFAKSESELAGAVAHEIGHIAARQHAGKIRRNQFASIGIGFLGPVVGGGIRATAAVAGARGGARGLFLRFTKEDDREADRIAAKMLYDTGYDPAGVLRFLQSVATLEETDRKGAQTYFRSHNGLDAREDSLNEILQTLAVKTPRYASNQELSKIQKRIASIKPKGALSSSDAAAAVLESATTEPESKEARHREVAALFAPEFHQGLGNEPRYDYITNFDFDGDWRGDNNWANASDKRFPLRGWIYYSVRETASHYFVHYAAFHPRDYKGGAGKGRLLSKAVRVATKPAASIDPTGRAAEAVFAHENDLEGCLVVIAKHGDDPKDGNVLFVETLSHNTFLKYSTGPDKPQGVGTVSLHGRRPQLYVEAKGHGIEALDAAGSTRKDPVKIYTFTGQAEDPLDDDDRNGPTGYDLVPIETTLWTEAQRGLTPAYGEVEDYGLLLVDEFRDGSIHEKEWRIGTIGSAFRGTVGGANLARPPWAWFDGKNKDQQTGHWYFDPARVIRRDFDLGAAFSTAYLP